VIQAPHVGLWLLSHPLVIALLGGAAAGDMTIALIVAVAVTPLLSERDDPEVGAAVTFAAIVVGTHISQSRAMGGILNESWLGSTLGLVCALVPTLLLAQLHTTVMGRTIKTAATVSIIVVLGHVIQPPSAAWGLAPWIAGGLFLIGMGRLAGSPPDPDRSPRRLATALALAATNVASAGAVLVLPVVWGLAEVVRSREPSGRLFQVLAAVGALPSHNLARVQLHLGDAAGEWRGADHGEGVGHGAVVPAAPLERSLPSLLLHGVGHFAELSEELEVVTIRPLKRARGYGRAADPDARGARDRTIESSPIGGRELGRNDPSGECDRRHSAP